MPLFSSFTALLLPDFSRWPAIFFLLGVIAFVVSSLENHARFQFQWEQKWIYRESQRCFFYPKRPRLTLEFMSIVVLDCPCLVNFALSCLLLWRYANTPAGRLKSVSAPWRHRRSLVIAVDSEVQGLHLVCLYWWGTRGLFYWLTLSWGICAQRLRR